MNFGVGISSHVNFFSLFTFGKQENVRRVIVEGQEVSREYFGMLYMTLLCLVCVMLEVKW